MFIKTRAQIINSDRVQRIFVWEELNRIIGHPHRGDQDRCVCAEIVNGLEYGDDGTSVPNYSHIALCEYRYGSEWHDTCRELVSALFDAINNDENFDVEEWLMDRKLRKGAEEINEMIKARKNK